MIPRLKFSEKYQNDVRRFKIGIEKLSNELSKKKAKQLLKELEKKVDLIDKMHSDGVTNIKSAREQIANTVALRHQLTQLLKLNN